MIVHELPQEIDGCTHVEEGRWRTDRVGHRITVEIRGGVMVGDVFVPQRSSGYATQWQEWSIGTDRWDDFEAFAAVYAAQPEEATKPLFWRSHAAALAYMLAVELGEHTPAGEE